MQTGDHFRDLVSRWPTMLQDERDAMARKAWSEGTGRAAQAMPIGVAMAPPAFDAQPLLADLARRGVHLRVSNGGTILACPGRALTPKDRETIGMHKAVFLDALGDEVAVA